MLNNVILVGRCVDEPKLVTLDNGNKVSNIVLAVQKPFRNENNEYDVDFIPVYCWGRLAEIICEYIGKGSILGFKCRLSTKIVEVGDKKLKCIDVIGERVAFVHTVRRSGTDYNSIDQASNLDGQAFDLEENLDNVDIKKKKIK